MKTNETKVNPEIVERVAKIKGARKGKDKVAAGFNATAYGKGMAETYVLGLIQSGKSWQDGIVYLLEHCDDKKREQAMNGAMIYCKALAEKADTDFNVSALRKRISEARRVFKAADIKGFKGVLATFKGPGTWAQKVAQTPKATTKGRKKGTGKLPIATPAEALASVKGAIPADTAPGHAKNHEVKVGDVIGMCQQLSSKNLLLVLDRIAFMLAQSKDIYEQSCGKKVMEFRDAQEHATLKKVVNA